MDRILNISGPVAAILNSYLYEMDKIARIARLTDHELQIIDKQVLLGSSEQEVFSDNDIFKYFEFGCIQSCLRPEHYWKYLFSQL